MTESTKIDYVSIVEDLRDEADLCRNETATDIADLLDDAASCIVAMKSQFVALRADLAAANERAERAEAERDALRADVAEAILILCAQFDTNGGDGIDAWLDELSMPDCEGRFDNIVGAIRAASDAERKP